MRSFRVVVLVGLIAALCAGSAGAGTARSQVAGHARAKAKAAAEGTVRVLVGLDTTFAPEGRMTAQARSGQHSRIHAGQNAVRKVLEGHRHRVNRAYDTVPYMALSLSEDAVDALASSGEVSSFDIDRPHRPALAQSSTLVEADDMATAGFTGAGFTVAILDTGVDKTHPFLASKVVEEACYSTTGGTATSVCPGGSDTTATGSGIPCAIEGCDHGTHVAGIAAGSGAAFSGVAKGASIMAVQVFSGDTSCPGSGLCPLAYTSDIIAGLQRVLVVNSTRPIAAVNLSLGGDLSSSACDSDPEKLAIDNLLSVGIPTVIATGNDGSSTSISSPACISTAVAVGSTTKSDGTSSFSNNDEDQTDLLAPGTSINSSVPGGLFDEFSGTSMATPHVTGAFALLKHAHPTATVATMLEALKSTGVNVPDSAAFPYTKPRIRILQAHTVLGGGGGGPLPDRHLQVSVGGRGKGRVNALGISCSKSGGDCGEDYADSTIVTFTATPTRRSRFVRWTGSLAGCATSRVCTIPIASDLTGAARFRRR